MFGNKLTGDNVRPEWQDWSDRVTALRRSTEEKLRKTKEIHERMDRKQKEAERNQETEKN